MPWASMPPISWRDDEERRVRSPGVAIVVFGVVTERIRRRSSASTSGTLTRPLSWNAFLTGTANCGTGLRGVFTRGESKTSPLGFLPIWKGDELQQPRSANALSGVGWTTYAASLSEATEALLEPMLTRPISSVMAENLG